MASDRVKATIKRLGLSGVNKPKRTPKHKTKSHVVVASEGGKQKTIRFGQQKNISKGKMSAAYWANKVKW